VAVDCLSLVQTTMLCCRPDIFWQIYTLDYPMNSYEVYVECFRCLCDLACWGGFRLWFHLLMCGDLCLFNLPSGLSGRWGFCRRFPFWFNFLEDVKCEQTCVVALKIMLQVSQKWTKHRYMCIDWLLDNGWWAALQVVLALPWKKPKKMVVIHTTDFASWYQRTGARAIKKKDKQVLINIFGASSRLAKRVEDTGQGQLPQWIEHQELVVNLSKV